MADTSLATKYRPQRFSDVVEQDVIKTTLGNQIKKRNFKNCLLFCGGAGTGKAQPLYSKVLTPNGFITMGEVVVGTEVITGNGNVTKVTGVYPQGVRPIYEITLKDRTKIRVSDEHLNVVYRYNQRLKCREDYVLTTKDLIEFNKRSKKFKLRIDFPVITSFAQSDDNLPMNPYLLGALLGDGCLKNNLTFSNVESDVLDKVNNILINDYGLFLNPIDDVSYRIVTMYDKSKYQFIYNGNTYTGTSAIINELVNDGYPEFDDETIIRVALGTAKNTIKHYPQLIDKLQLIVSDDYDNTCINQLRRLVDDMELNVNSVDKHIPTEYLLADYDIRLNLLRGLFDTDGYIDRDGNAVFATSSSRLSEDFAFLVRSLGCRDTISTHASSYVNEDDERVVCHDSYRHIVKFPNDLIFFTSEKHSLRYKKRQNEPIRTIVSIEYIGDEECQCIYVDDESHTYISDNFIPTHNTTNARIFANEINNFQGRVIEIDAASHNGVDDARHIIEEAKTQSLDSEYKVILLDECHMMTVQAWNALLKLLEEPPKKTIFLACTTDPQKIPPAVLSRLQRYNFQRISLNGIINRLKYIIESENAEGVNEVITFEDSALEYIAKRADGGMRDAITLLENAIGDNNNLTLDNVLSALGSAKYDTMF